MLDEHDAGILDEIRHLHERVDAVPEGLVDRVKIAMTVEALAAEVAQLTTTALVASRSDGQKASDTITFSTDDLTLMISVSELTEASATVDGWSTRAGVRVEVHTSDQTLVIDADEHGRFALGGLPRGRTWLVVHPQPGTTQSAVVTPVVEL